MDNLIFSLNATMPVFALMVLGFFLNRVGWLRDDLAGALNKFVFRLPLPVLVFSQLADADFRATWDARFVLFCFLSTLASILFVTLLSRFVKKREARGEFIQAAYRSSAALLGIAYIQNIYGSAEMSALMILGSVPLYNVCAVAVLVLTSPDARETRGKELVFHTAKGIVTNPIILGILFGFLWSIFRIPMPTILGKVVSNVAATATPLGLMAMGASIEVKKIRGQLLPSVAAAFLKLFGLAAIFLPIAVTLGFRNEKLIAILIMLGSATTVSSFVMAKNMGHEGTLTSNTVVLTTVLSSFTLTFWVFVLRSLNLI